MSVNVSIANGNGLQLLDRHSYCLAHPVVVVIEEDDDPFVEVERSERRQLKLPRSWWVRNHPGLHL